MTGDAEFEEVQQLVRQCVARIEGTPLLARGTASALLRDWAANYKNHDSRAMTLSSISAAARWKWSPEMTTDEKRASVAALVADSGIATIADDEFRFVSTAVYNYLLAEHVVAQEQTRMPLLQRNRIRIHLRPAAERDEQTDQLMRFLVFLWWPDKRQSVSRQLDVFLKERNRYPNILFVADLCRRAELPGSDLRERTTTILRKEVGSAARPEPDWRRMVESLHALDASAAFDALDDAVRSPGPEMQVQRAFLAVLELTKRHAVRGAATLVHLAYNLWGTAEEQIEVACRIREIDYRLGTETLVRLAKNVELGDWRETAALLVDDPSLWGELVRDGTMSDDPRLRLLAKVIEHAPDIALDTVEAFWTSAHAEKTRLHIAELTVGIAFDMAWQIASDVVWTRDRDVEGSVRLAGVLLLGKFDPAKAQELLVQFVADPIGGGEARLRAAILLLEQYRSLAGLEKVVLAKEIELSLRADAAKRIGQRDAPRGAKAYIVIAEDCPPDTTCLMLLHAAFKLSRQPAVEALVGIAENERAPDAIRVEAVEIALPNLPRKRRFSLYETIVRTATYDEIVIQLAQTVMNRNTDWGERLMAVAATRPMPFELRLDVARKARRHGERVLADDLGGQSRLPAERFAAALALAEINSRAAAWIIDDLARHRKNDGFRVRAAVLLPQWDVLPCLQDIVCDHHEEESVRRAACDSILTRDDVEGRSLLAELAEYSQVPNRTRDYIYQLLRL